MYVGLHSVSLAASVAYSLFLQSTLLIIGTANELQIVDCTREFTYHSSSDVLPVAELRLIAE